MAPDLIWVEADDGGFHELHRFNKGDGYRCRCGYECEEPPEEYETQPLPVDRRRVVRDGFVLRGDIPDHLRHWFEHRQTANNYEDHHKSETSHQLAVITPKRDPLPNSVDTHRSGTCFEKETTEMRPACREPIEKYLGASVSLIEVRHNRQGCHTDLVCAVIDPEALAERVRLHGDQAALHGSVQRMNVWWYLRRHGPISYDEAVHDGYYADKHTNRQKIDWLYEHGYVAETTTGYVDAVVPPSICELHAIELKLRDWRTAVEQAERSLRADVREYRSKWEKKKWGYADKAWVALDAGSINGALEHIDVFDDAGVGLLAVAEGGSVIEHRVPTAEPRGEYTRDRAWAESLIFARADASVLDWQSREQDVSADDGQVTLDALADGGDQA